MLKLFRPDIRVVRRWYSNVNVPFHDDLTSADDELFGLEDFQHYKESPDVVAKKQALLFPPTGVTQPVANDGMTFEEAAMKQEPMVFISKVSDPYLNLAIEDYIYNKMPLPEHHNYNRLLFYINKPCVVVGKNQNPWKEVNLPLLNSLHIPLLRRKSGGGTVVHDSGNVNFSFMTTKNHFSRLKFVNIIVDALNNWGNAKYKLEVNDRGDITTVTQADGVNYKISGSAYKLSKGKSYHHGTMLLNSRLDILGKLLSTNPTKNGIVGDTVSINSVRSKVANIEINSEEFQKIVTDAFKQGYGMKMELSEEEREHNSLLGLDDFLTSNEVQIFTINKNSQFNTEILQTADELKQWSWKFGNTPKFSHEFINDKFGIKIKFIIGRNAIVEDFKLEIEPKLLSETKITESFQFLRYIIDQNKHKAVDERLKYKGSDVAGFITNDELSDWIGECIDGTM